MRPPPLSLPLSGPLWNALRMTLILSSGVFSYSLRGPYRLLPLVVAGHRFTLITRSGPEKAGDGRMKQLDVQQSLLIVLSITVCIRSYGLGWGVFTIRSGFCSSGARSFLRLSVLILFQSLRAGTVAQKKGRNLFSERPLDEDHHVVVSSSLALLSAIGLSSFNILLVAFLLRSIEAKKWYVVSSSRGFRLFSYLSSNPLQSRFPQDSGL